MENKRQELEARISELRNKLYTLQDGLRIGEAPRNGEVYLYQEIAAAERELAALDAQEVTPDDPLYEVRCGLCIHDGKCIRPHAKTDWCGNCRDYKPEQEAQ